MPSSISRHERSDGTARLIRAGMWLSHGLRRLYWFVVRPVTRGVRAIPVTPDGRVVLVRHSYVPGWHLPGGGWEAGEAAESAMLRELREEIGLVSHGSVTWLEEYFHRPNHKRDTVQLFHVADVVVVPRLSLEIEAVAAWPPDALPADATAATRRQVAQWVLRAGADGGT